MDSKFEKYITFRIRYNFYKYRIIPFKFIRGATIRIGIGRILAKSLNIGQLEGWDFQIY